MLQKVLGAIRPKGPYVTAMALIVLGAPLLFGGLWLAGLGGSPYYIIAGIGLIATGGLLWFGSIWGLRLYWCVLAITLVWALGEVGFAPWPLVPRLLGPALIGGWLCLPFVRRKIDAPTAPSFLAWAPPAWVWPAAAGAVLIFVLGVSALSGPRPENIDSVAAAEPVGWPHIGNSLGGARYATADQINTENVAGLREAWRFNIGHTMATLEATPILAAGQLAFCTADNVVVALDPETGAENWRFNPEADTEQRMHLACRGLAQAEIETAASDNACGARIYTATIDARLIALDAKTGAPCEGFGDHGTVSLMEGIGEQPRGFYYATSAPLVSNGVVVVGSYVMDNQRVNAPSGVVRAYDVETGALRWAWDMGRPDRIGAPSEGETYTPGTPNAWTNLSADPDLGLVYVPLGNPAPDFWGGARRDFDERYGSSVVALSLETGRPAWSFQTTHHDVWDYDVPAQPVLIDLPTPAGVQPALIAATKRGQLFVLNRRTGAPIFPVQERPTPQGASQGDWLAPSQPYSALSLAPRRLRETDTWGMTPFDHLYCRIAFRRLRYDGDFTPPGVTASIKYPGAFGIMDWGGVAIDEDRAILVANTSYMASIDHLVPRDEAPEYTRAVSDLRLYEWGPQEDTPFVINTRFFLSPLRVPCLAPPWGRMNALNLRTGELMWSRPLGTARDSGPLDIPSQLPLEMGVPNMGGAIVTRGGLAFIGAAVDHYFRAYDVASGKELWRARLPASANSIPMTFVSAENGRQYVVVAAGGHLGMAPHLGDAIIAYALPEARAGD